MKAQTLFALTALFTPIALTSCGNKTSNQSASAEAEAAQCANVKPLTASLELSYFNMAHTAADFNVAGRIATITDSIFSANADNGTVSLGGLNQVETYTFGDDNQLVKKVTVAEDYTLTLDYKYENGRFVSSCVAEGECTTSDYGENYIIHWQGDGRDSLILADGKPVKDIVEGPSTNIYEYSYSADGFSRKMVSFENYETGEEIIAGENQDVMTFNKYGRIVNHSWYLTTPDDVRSAVFVYDDNGDLIRETRDNGVNQNDSQYSYSNYDAQGNWRSCTFIIHIGGYGDDCSVTHRDIRYRE